VTEPEHGAISDDAVDDGIDPSAAEEEIIEGELVDTLPMTVAVGELESGHWTSNPTVQAAAAAATGFVAGAATVALMRRYGLRRMARQVGDVRDVLDQTDPRRRGRPAPGDGQTYIVHVRVLTPRSPE
jgi:hypothetical protein